MRIVFDTNIFSDHNFSKLEPYLHLIRRHRVFGNSKALDELMHSTDGELHIAPIKRFLSLTNDRWFQEGEKIIEKEFLFSKGCLYWFIPYKEQKFRAAYFQNFKKNSEVQDFTEGEKANQDFADIMQEYKDNKLLRDLIKSTRISTFDEFWNHEISAFLQGKLAKLFLESWVSQEKHESLYRQYIIRPNHYPYFHCLLRAMVFMVFDSNYGKNGKEQVKIDIGADLPPINQTSQK